MVDMLQAEEAHLQVDTLVEERLHLVVHMVVQAEEPPLNLVARMEEHQHLLEAEEPPLHLVARMEQHLHLLEAEEVPRVARMEANLRLIPLLPPAGAIERLLAAAAAVHPMALDRQQGDTHIEHVHAPPPPAARVWTFTVHHRSSWRLSSSPSLSLCELRVVESQMQTAVSGPTRKYPQIHRKMSLLSFGIHLE